MKLMNRESEIIELWPKSGTSSGLHLLGEWYGCSARRALLDDATYLQRLCRFAAEGAGLKVVADHFHRCAPSGVTGTILLNESHLVIHTWPVDRSVTLDIFIGMHTRNSRMKARAVYSFLKDDLKPEKENFLQVNRGGLDEKVSEPG